MTQICTFWQLPETTDIIHDPNACIFVRIEKKRKILTSYNFQYLPIILTCVQYLQVVLKQKEAFFLNIDFLLMSLDLSYSWINKAPDRWKGIFLAVVSEINSRLLYHYY